LCKCTLKHNTDKVMPWEHAWNEKFQVQEF
jgi:hypothetical protein